MVIVGAGASYDSVSTRPPGVAHTLERYRPPLADQLFEPRDTFEAMQRLLPQVMQIASSLYDRSGGQSVEDVLARFASEIPSYSDRSVQLAAVRFYLQAVIAECEFAWVTQQPVATNMMRLVDEIEAARHGRERPIFVTFNYDRLIEGALANRGQEYSSLLDYVRPNVTRVFKLHGSVNWARRLQSFDPTPHTADVWTAAKTVCHNIAHLPEKGPIELFGGVPSSLIDGNYALPAIAIPLKQKSEFECPESHIDELKKLLPRVRTILTIGWRGAERHFLNLLRASGLARFDGICVGGNDADDTKHNLLSVVPGLIETYSGGFSAFLREGKLQRLLNITWQ